MERGTMEYISRRTRNNERKYRDEDTRRNEDDMRNDDEYENGRISGRYGRTGAYRMENHYSSGNKETNKIGFAAGTEKGEKDFIYEMEEALENGIDDIVFYSEMAMEADTKGHTEFSNAFYEIAKEKYTCTEFIRLRLMKIGAYDPSKQTEIEERYDRAKHLFKRL